MRTSLRRSWAGPPCGRIYPTHAHPTGDATTLGPFFFLTVPEGGCNLGFQSIVVGASGIACFSVRYGGGLCPRFRSKQATNHRL